MLLRGSLVAYDYFTDYRMESADWVQEIGMRETEMNERETADNLVMAAAKLQQL